MKCLFFFLIIGFILAACEGEEFNPTGVKTAIRLNAEIEGMRTRASGTTWVGGDAIGVYMKIKSEELGATALKKNVKYIYNEGTGHFEPMSENETLYFPTNGEAVDFIGYYPYREDISAFTLPIDLTVQSQQSIIDLMYADNVKNVSQEESQITMSFSHKLSRIVFQMEHYLVIEQNDFAVIITGVPTAGSFDLTDGSLTVDSATTDIACCVNDDFTLAEAILMPGTDLSGSNLWFLIDGGEIAYKVPLNTLFNSGPLIASTQYTFNAVLYTDKVKVETDSTEIIPWITPPSVTFTAERSTDTPPQFKGTEANPYSVAQAIDKQGKKDVWVKGYIVGAFKTTINNFVTDPSSEARTNIALADSPGETEASRMLLVNFTTAALKDALNICDNPSNIGRQVMIKGDFSEYYSVPGMRNPYDYKFLE